MFVFDPTRRALSGGLALAIGMLLFAGCLGPVDEYRSKYYACRTSHDCLPGFQCGPDKTCVRMSEPADGENDAEDLPTNAEMQSDDDGPADQTGDGDRQTDDQLADLGSEDRVTTEMPTDVVDAQSDTAGTDVADLGSGDAVSDLDSVDVSGGLQAHAGSDLQVTIGGTVTLKGMWSNASGSPSCVWSRPDGDVFVSTECAAQVTPTETTTYKLTVTDDSGSSSDLMTVVVQLKVDASACFDDAECQSGSCKSSLDPQIRLCSPAADICVAFVSATKHTAAVGGTYCDAPAYICEPRTLNWTKQNDCPFDSPTCFENRCRCTENDVRCSNFETQSCDAQGGWKSSPCDLGCQYDGTTAPVCTECNPGTRRCGSSIEVCHSAGSLWQTVTCTNNCDCSNLKFADVAVSRSAVCAVAEGAGALYCWGGNQKGQLGIISPGTSTPTLVPNVALSTLTAGDDHFCGLTIHGKVYCWGDNEKGQLGGKGVDISAPIDGNSDWTVVRAGSDFTCGIRNSGVLYCWGNNEVGKTGLGVQTETTSTPGLVDNSGKWVDVAPGVDHACGLKEVNGKNELYCWGNNEFAQFGQELPAQVLMPMKIGSQHWKRLLAGRHHTCGIRDDDTLHCWGLTSKGQVGTGGLNKTKPPTRIEPGANPNTTTMWASLTPTARNSTCAITASGTLYCWGDNNDGQLGIRGSLILPKPTAVDAEKWFKVALGTGSGCGIKQDKSLWCWGLDDQGQSGNGTTLFTQRAPAPAAGTILWSEVRLGTTQACGIDEKGKLYCWGTGPDGLGFDTTSLLNNKQTVPRLIDDGPFSELALGDGFGCAIRSDNGNMWCWGKNDYGQLGNPTASVAPRLVSSGAWKRIVAGAAHACGIREDNSLACWGLNDGHQVNESSTLSFNSFQTMFGGAKFKSVTAGYQFTCAIRMNPQQANDDSLVCWGVNSSGQLGQNDQAVYTTAQDVSGNATWLRIAAGKNHVCGLRSDGTLWCWGSSQHKKAGSDQPTVNEPAQVGSSTWNDVFAGLNNTCVLLAGGVRCLGDNRFGTLGIDGTLANTGTLEVVVPADKDQSWASLAISLDDGSVVCGIQSNKLLRCWGKNDYGQFGNGARSRNYRPVQVIIPQ